VEPTRLILIGLGGVLLGVALPLLMVLRVIQPSFLVGLIAITASVGGVVLGMVGSAMYLREHRPR